MLASMQARQQAKVYTMASPSPPPLPNGFNIENV